MPIFFYIYIAFLVIQLIFIICLTTQKIPAGVPAGIFQLHYAVTKAYSSQYTSSK